MHRLAATLVVLFAHTNAFAYTCEDVDQWVDAGFSATVIRAKLLATANSDEAEGCLDDRLGAEAGQAEAADLLNRAKVPVAEPMVTWVPEPRAASDFDCTIVAGWEALGPKDLYARVQLTDDPRSAEACLRARVAEDEAGRALAKVLAAKATNASLEQAYATRRVGTGLIVAGGAGVVLGSGLALMGAASAFGHRMEASLDCMSSFGGDCRHTPGFSVVPYAVTTAVFGSVAVTGIGVSAHASREIRNNTVTVSGRF